jgi:hypothetical protein
VINVTPPSALEALGRNRIATRSARVAQCEEVRSALQIPALLIFSGIAALSPTRLSARSADETAHRLYPNEPVDYPLPAS